MIKPAQVQATINNSASTMVLTLNNVTAGNLLTYQVSWSNAGTGSAGPPSVVTDTNGTWSVAINPSGVSNGTGRFNGAATYYLQNANAGTHVVTFTAIGTAGWSNYGTLTEWSGALTSGALDTATAASASSSTNTNSISVTTGAAVSTSISLLLYQLVIDSNSASTNGGLTGPATYTNTSFAEDFVDDLGVVQSFLSINPSSGSYTAVSTWTDTAQLWVQSSIVAFKGIQPTPIGPIAWISC